MPRNRYERRELTHNWEDIRPLLKDSAQITCEIIRPVVLFGVSPKERAEETGMSKSAIDDKANLFDVSGMASLMPPSPPPAVPKQDKRTLPPLIRQAIVDAHDEYPELSLHEIASMCYVQFGRKPSHHTIKYILATGPSPSRTTRRCKRFAEIDNPMERRRTILNLHSEGWTAKNSAGYLAMHRLGGGMIWCISILENFSRAILASAISRKQDNEAFFAVFYAAVRKYGVPLALVSDNGSIFTSHDTGQTCEQPGIEKQEMKKGRPYQNYIEAALYVIGNLNVSENWQITCILWTWNDQWEKQFHIIGVQRRMEDWPSEKAPTWEDLLAAHEKWLRDYNFQRYMAHEDRDDGCHSPAQVFNWQRGMQPEPELIYRAFAAIGEARVLNKAGYAKFRNFLLYGELGLAGRETLVNIFQETLTLEYGEHPLSKYSVEWQPDDRHLLRVGNPRLYQHPYLTPQFPLRGTTEVEWHVIIRCEPAAHRRRRVVRSVVIQLPLSLEQETTV